MKEKRGENTKKSHRIGWNSKLFSKGEGGFIPGLCLDTVDGTL